MLFLQCFDFLPQSKNIAQSVRDPEPLLHVSVCLLVLTPTKFFLKWKSGFPS